MCTLWHRRFDRTLSYSAKVCARLNFVLILEKSADCRFFSTIGIGIGRRFRGRNNRPSAKHFFIKFYVHTLTLSLNVWSNLQCQSVHIKFQNSSKIQLKFIKSLIKKCLADGRLFLSLKLAADTDTDC